MVMFNWNQINATHCWKVFLPKSEQECEKPSMMTHHSAQPKPVWKKAAPGLQRPSRTGSSISGVLYWPKLSVPHLGPDPRPSNALIHRDHSIILNKDFCRPVTSSECKNLDLRERSIRGDMSKALLTLYIQKPLANRYLLKTLQNQLHWSKAFYIFTRFHNDN